MSSDEEAPLKIVRNIILLLLAASLFWLLAGCQSDNSPPILDLASIPLEQALSSGKPTLAEFGRGVCVPCKEMKPILEELATEYEGKLNVVIVEIDDHMDQVRQYEIMVIPTQVFFDSNGKEVIRHMGFLPKEDIIAQLKMMGIE
jgi:thioredoxin 1